MRSKWQRVPRLLASMAIVLALVATLSSTAGSATQSAAAPQAKKASDASTFQVTYDGESFDTTLPTSSAATYTWSPGSSTVNSTKLTTNSKGDLDLPPSTGSVSFGSSNSTYPNITVNPDTSYQHIAGFGGALTSSSAFVINNSPERTQILDALFGSSGADFNTIRLPLGASDFMVNPLPSCSDKPTCYAPSPKCDKEGVSASSTCFQSYDNTANDPDLADFSEADSNFSVANDGPDTIPVLESVKGMDSGLQIVAEPWSPPGWMKESGDFLSDCSGSDGSLNPTDESAFAAYLTRTAQHYQSQGLPFSMLSIQNEPQNCSSSYPTMTMTPTEQGAVASDLASDFEAAGLSPVPQIMGYDHNWYSPGEGTTTCSNNSTYGPTDYPEQLLAAPGGTDVQDIGFHSYCGDSSVQDTLSSDDPSVGMYVTESTGTFKSEVSGKVVTYTAAQNLVNEVKNDLIDPIDNGAAGSLYWNLALDQDCGPQFSGSTKSCPATEKNYAGCTSCRPLVTVNTQSTSKSPSDAVCFDENSYCLNQDYYYWAQFSKFVEPGAVRIASSTVGSLDTVAFQNPPASKGGNGDTVLVVLSGSTPTTSLWQLQSIPNPVDNTTAWPQAVTCVSDTFCEALGTYQSSAGGGDWAVFDDWNGSVWALQSQPAPVDSQLLGVSCVSPTFCEAVGTEFNGSSFSALTELWNGTNWTIQTTPNAAGNVVILDSVSCISTTFCETLGSSEAADGDYSNLAEVWNGTKWAMQSITGNGSPGGLSGVSCTSTSFCYAVGSQEAYRWNGTKWSGQSKAPEAGSVSCISDRSCEAVSGSSAEGWNGTKWTVQSLAPSGNDAGLEAVSCPSSGFCAAVGNDGSGGTLAEVWDGTTWTIQATPNPTSNSSSGLSEVSCSSVSYCEAVGAEASTSSSPQVIIAEGFG